MPDGSHGRVVGLKPASPRTLSRFRPMRFGRPPGWTKRPKTAIEEVIRDTHILALDAWNTS